MIRRILFALALAFCSCSGWAQVATGIYPNGSVDTPGFDIIDRGSLNVHFVIPIVNKSGRGLPFQYSLEYDTSVWAPANSAGSKLWTPDASFGVHGYLLNDGYKGFLSYLQGQTKCFTSGSNWYFVPTYSNFVYHDSFGSQHSFYLIYIPCTGRSSGDGSTNDGSGFSLDTSFKVHANDGAALALPTYVNGAVASTQSTITDANGNQIVNQSGVFTDTTGAKILSTTGSGTAASPKVFSYLTYGTNPNNTSPPSAGVTITYITHTVQTAFGCSGVGEYNQSVDLVDKITLADSSFYQFKYEATPGNSSNVTGRLASITLPQGGTIAYSYTGGSNGINCADGSATGITRTTSDGTRTYVRTSITTTSSQTSITDSLTNKNVSTYSFVTAGSPTAFYETSRANYQGAASGTPLLSRQTCYNGSASPCSTTAVSLPITQIDTYESLNGGGEHGSTAKYNTYGLQTEQDIYDFGSASARGSLLRKEAWVYPSSGIVSLVSSDTVTDGSGNQIGLTTYAYDETSGAGHAALVTTSGLPQHGGTVGSQRGNLTTTTQWNNLGTSVTTTSSYEDTGNPVSTTTPNGVSQYAYDSGTHAFMQTNTPPTPSSGVSLPTSATSDSTSGLPLTTTDPNGAQTVYKTYDAFLRPKEVDVLDSSSHMVGKQIINYSTNQTGILNYQSASVYADTEMLADGYGRTIRGAVFNGQSNAWYQQDTCYDANGNTHFTSYTYQANGWGGSPSQVCSGAGDTYSYDALGRPITISHADSTSIGYTYNGGATQVKDENGVTRINQVDGLGRPTSVCEVSSASQQGVAPVACGQDISATGFLTSYSYTTDSSKDQVTTIMQGSQTRIAVVDSLGRTVSATEPERGPTTYSYAYNSTGLQITRQRYGANQSSACIQAKTCTLTTTTSQYDALGRVVSVNYNDSITVPKSFSYDANPSGGWAGQTGTNLNGRLAYMQAGLGSQTATLSGSMYSYDAMGRVIKTWQCGPDTCETANQASHWVSLGYDWTGNITSEYDPAAGNITYGRSPAGEITSITNQSFTMSGASGSATLLSSAQNGPNGPVSFNYGNGLSQDNTYDSLGRINGGWVCIGAPSAACPNQRNGFALAWSGSRVSTSTENYLGTAYYQYDDFNRLTGMQNSSRQTTYNYVYDRYGNRWQQNALQGGQGFSQAYNAATNQLSSGGYTYDAAGNMTYDASGGHHFTYDAEGNILQVDSGSWTFVFDALNRRIFAKTSAGAVSVNVFDPAGRSTSSWSAPTTPNESHIYADGVQLAYRSGDGQTYFNHRNWLNTDRVHTDLNGATGATYTSLPFGDGGSENVSENYAGWNFEHFGDMDVDYWDSTYHAQFRNYSELQARWLSPDPYDGSYDLSNPQSFNRYAYVLNNPLSLTDPSGLDTGADPCGYSDDGTPIYCTTTSGGQGGDGAGPGTYPCLDFLTSYDCIGGNNGNGNSGSTAYGGSSSAAPTPSLGPPHLAPGVCTGAAVAAGASAGALIGSEVGGVVGGLIGGGGGPVYEP